MGPQWDREIVGIVENVKNKPEDRARALDLMQLCGPFPATQLLAKLARDRNPEVRAKAAYLMGLHADRSTEAALTSLLKDSDANVRRMACESLMRSGANVAIPALLPLLADKHRHVAWAASRAVQSLESDEWRQEVIAAKDVRVFIVGSLALMALDTDEQTATAILNRCGEVLKGYVSDRDFVDMLRLIQVTLHRSGLKVEDVPQIAAQLEQEYPSKDLTINRELIRVLVYLQQSAIIPRLLAEFEKDSPLPDKIHAAAHARYIESGWTTEQKITLLEFYEQNRELPGGHSYALYLDNLGRDFFAQLDESERIELLRHGERAPSAALTSLAALPEHPGEELLSQLIEVDGRLIDVDVAASRRLRTGIVAVLGRSRAPRAMSYLRERFAAEPNRRSEIAMGLAQDPAGDNWPLLVQAIPTLDGPIAVEIIRQLGTVDNRPDRPEAIRQLILCSMRLRDKGGDQAIKLLEKWTGEHVGGMGGTWEARMSGWQNWFAQTYPNQPPAVLPVEPEGNKWSVEELLTFLGSSDGGHGDVKRGGEIFEKAQCVKCHRFGTRGDSVGPDLTAVSQRFQRKEIVESVIFPSLVISDQYASKTVFTNAGLQFTGIVGEAGVGTVVVLQANGEKVSLLRNDIDQISPSTRSAMPEGLFNSLTLEEIADLFAYLASSSSKSKSVAEGTSGPRPKPSKR